MAAHAEPLPTPAAEERESQLTPTLTRKMLLLFIVGDILGGGIYARTGEVAGEIGGAIWTGFALAGVIAAFTAASYAELGPSTRRPRAPRSTSTRRSRRRC